MQRDVADRPAAAPEPVGAAPEPEPGAAGTAPGRPPGWPGRRALAVEGLVFYLALQLLTVPFLPALRDSRQAFYDDVLVGFFMPEKHGLAKLLRDGFLPTWLDNQYGGEPLMLRVPSRWLLLFSFPLAATAALGTDVLLHADVGDLRRRLLRGLGGLAVVGLVLGVALVVGGHSTWADSRRYWALAAAAGAVAWLAAGCRRVPRAAAALLLLGVTAVELQQARPAAEYHQLAPNVVYDQPGPIMERLGRERGRYVSTAWDRADTTGRRRSVAIPDGYGPRMRRLYLEGWPRRLAARSAWEYATNAETVSGRDGGLLPLRTYQEFFAAAVDPKGAPDRRGDRGAAVGVGLAGAGPAGGALVRHRRPAAGADPGDGAQRLPDRGRAAWFLLWERQAPPLARMQYDVDVVPDGDERWRLRAGYPLLERAIVEEPLAGLARPSTPPEVRVRQREQTRVRVSVRTAGDGLLVLADPWYPQWRVRVDGRPAELLRVDHAFRGVRVPAGSHEVVFTYEDRAMRLGAGLAVATCLALAGVVAWRRVLRRAVPAP